MAKVMPDQSTGRNHRIPQGDQWMFESASRNPSSNVSYGLSFLNSVWTLFIQQEAHLGQTITDLSSAQRSQVCNQKGQLVFYGAENQMRTLYRLCCAARRAFILYLSDQSNQVWKNF